MEIILAFIETIKILIQPGIEAFNTKAECGNSNSIPQNPHFESKEKMNKNETPSKYKRAEWTETPHNDQFQNNIAQGHLQSNEIINNTGNDLSMKTIDGAVTGGIAGASSAILSKNPKTIAQSSAVWAMGGAVYGFKSGIEEAVEKNISEIDNEKQTINNMIINVQNNICITNIYNINVSENKNNQESENAKK